MTEFRKPHIGDTVLVTGQNGQEVPVRVHSVLSDTEVGFECGGVAFYGESRREGDWRWAPSAIAEQRAMTAAIAAGTRGCDGNAFVATPRDAGDHCPIAGVSILPSKAPQEGGMPT